MDPIETSSPPPSPTSLDQENDPEFDAFFQELLDISWDQYLAMDEELELEQPARVPNAQADSIKDQDPVPEACSVEQLLISHDDAMESLLKIQISNLNDTKLFDLLEQALNHIQSKRTQTEMNSKSVQSSLLKFFHKSKHFLPNMVKLTKIQYLVHTMT